MKKIILTIMSLTIMLNAEVLPLYKTSLGLVGGLGELQYHSEKKSALIGGLTWRTEKRISHSNFYYGVGIDFIQSDKFNLGTINGKRVNAEYNSIGLYPTIGYNFSRNLSTNIMIGGAYNKFELKYDSIEGSESKVGLLYGASIDYKLGNSLTNGLMYRGTSHSIDGLNKDLKTNSLLYRIGISF